MKNKFSYFYLLAILSSIAFYTHASDQAAASDEHVIFTALPQDPALRECIINEHNEYLAANIKKELAILAYNKAQEEKRTQIAAEEKINDKIRAQRLAEYNAQTKRKAEAASQAEAHFMDQATRPLYGKNIKPLNPFGSQGNQTSRYTCDEERKMQRYKIVAKKLKALSEEDYTAVRTMNFEQKRSLLERWLNI